MCLTLSELSTNSLRSRAPDLDCVRLSGALNPRLGTEGTQNVLVDVALLNDDPRDGPPRVLVRRVPSLVVGLLAHLGLQLHHPGRHLRGPLTDPPEAQRGGHEPLDGPLARPRKRQGAPLQPDRV